MKEDMQSFLGHQVENRDFYFDPRGYRVMTAYYLASKGYCCGNGCRHCPYFPSHQKGNRVLKDETLLSDC
jgi:hypothetical protein